MSIRVPMTRINRVVVTLSMYMQFIKIVIFFSGFEMRPAAELETTPRTRAYFLEFGSFFQELSASFPESER